MSASGRARGMVADWTLQLVRGLPEDVARDRFDEIASDLWEQQHAAESHGRRPALIAAAILLRAARGVPADLAWRWSAGRRAASRTPTTTWADRAERTTMTRRPDPAAKPWVHLEGPEKPFDQTNGAVDFDTPDKHDAANPELTMLERGAATSMLSVGGLGLGG